MYTTRWKIIFVDGEILEAVSFSTSLKFATVKEFNSETILDLKTMFVENSGAVLMYA